ncbi:Rhodanese-like protein [Serendipita vermifera]|nr:Rhodanese-like protein [Serendipita vermifera]
MATHESSSVATSGADAASSQQPWPASLPEPVSKPKHITPEELKAIITKEGAVSGRDYIVVDVRRTDFENAFIKGAVNLPAQSFYQTLPTTATVLGNTPQVIFHCNHCTPTGRGPRCAGWYADEIARQGKSSEALVLEGGIQNWLSQYGDVEDLTVSLNTK